MNQSDKMTPNLQSVSTVTKHIKLYSDNPIHDAIDRIIESCEREKSIATELSIDITQYTRDHAAAIVGNQIREIRLKSDLCQSLLDPAFDKYRETLELFGFGYVMQATILTNIYPLEKFLLAGKPHIDRYEDDRGKHKKNMSLAGFQISLGMGKRLIESGGSTTLIYSGSSFARKILYSPLSFASHPLANITIT